ncbi:MAG TPA: tetratricopeptide repeat protein, partial [Solirubrobacterales bacterium]|nr:tetratricopeptide repeat protein [Solirubrobacterales bacterium]
RLFEQARWRFERAIEIDPECVPAYLGAGGALLELELAEEAIGRFKQVAEVLDQSSGAAFGGWGRASTELDDNEDAVQRFRKAIDLDSGGPASINHLLDLGESLLALRRFSEAIDAYEDVIALERRFVASTWQRCRARYNRAVVALELDSPREALAYCYEGLGALPDADRKRSPTAAALHFVAGAARAMLLHYGDAVESFHQASEASELFALHAMNATARIYAAQGKYADCWRELGRVDEAYVRVKEVHGPELNNDQAEAYGLALFWLDRLDEAEAAFEAALGPYRRSASAWARLMGLYIERREQAAVDDAGNWQWEAFNAYQKAVSLLEAQCEDRRSAEPLSGLGMLHLLMDDLDKAEDALKEAAALDSGAPEPPAGLGVVHMKRGQHSKAIRQLKLALKRDPGNLTLQCHLANAYFRLGRHEMALDVYDGVLRRAPNNVGARIGAGEIFVEQAQATSDDLLYEDAESHFTCAVTLAQSVLEGSPDRAGSTGLWLRQWVDLYYARGYARVKMYEVLMDGRIGHPPRAARRLLERARDDFEAAAAKGVSAHRSERAAERVKARLKLFSPATLEESWAPLVVVGVAFVMLVLVQVSFLTAGGFGGETSLLSYSTLTLALLALIVAGFYLPQILRLKLGGIELEKVTRDVASDEALLVSRHPFQASLHGVFEPDIPHSRQIEREAGPVPL